MHLHDPKAKTLIRNRINLFAYPGTQHRRLINSQEQNSKCPGGLTHEMYYWRYLKNKIGRSDSLLLTQTLSFFLIAVCASTHSILSFPRLYTNLHSFAQLTHHEIIHFYSLPFGLCFKRARSCYFSTTLGRRRRPSKDMCERSTKQ